MASEMKCSDAVAGEPTATHWAILIISKIGYEVCHTANFGFYYSSVLMSANS